ncbi:MAG TPA: translation initiation factor IF-3 [bacterium]|nr:translation initiation factor IF-3 [bacterium]HOL47311.1 translation initiation factor IF-3 [bacterium]HPQ17648.1 translation initiation factor IF-3 [bacterium]
MNEEIRVPEVRVISENNEQIGILPVSKALSLAKEKMLDLVEISPTATPPVCRIMDYGKYLYEKQKKEKITKKKQKTIQIKELKIRPSTDMHDIEYKIKHAREFLEEGNKVKFTVKFKGRELMYQDLAKDKLTLIIEKLNDIAIVEVQPTVQGKIMYMIVAKKTDKK